MRANLTPVRWVTLCSIVSACAAGDAAQSPTPDATLGDDAADVTAVYDAPTPLDAMAPAVCGDGVCTRGQETCTTCPLDCNRCPTCDMAPSCTGALAVPLTSARLATCDNTSGSTQRTNYACGTDLGVAPAATTCADPQLRIRVKEMSIQRGFFDVPRNLYCVISAEDGRHSELLLISPREVAGNRNTTTINLRPSEGVLWGQGDLYRSISNITITYGCFLASDGAAAQRVLMDIAGRAGMVSQHADGYGWVFGTVAVIGTILGSSLGTIRDTQILDVQQTIAAGALLSLTNAKTWEIRIRRGNLDLSGASDLRLTLESWGCAGVRSVVP
jgi:hypothetical protein